MRKTTLVILEITEDDFPTRVPADATIETTAEQLPESSSRIRRVPTGMLPPPLRRLAAWVRGA